MWLGSLAFVLSVAAVEGARLGSLRWGWMDRPNERSSHIQPTPRIGGVGVIVAIVLALVLAWSQGWSPGHQICWLLAGSSGMAVIGFADDLFGIDIRIRLLFQLAFAAAVVVGGGVTVSTGAGAAVSSAVSIVWIVWTTNFYNFMDGSDGLAAGQGVIALLAFTRLLGGELEPVGLAGVGALCGFLLHNTSPARIFMGDALSTSLGCLFGGLAILVMKTQHSVWPGLLPVYVFAFDATTTLVRRMLRRERWWSAHRSHAYQLLIQDGWTHRSVQMLYLALAATTAELAIAWNHLSSGSAVALLVALNAGLSAVLMVIWRRAASHAAPPAS
jgi:Fuc2NAc and GlcNAc transferase